MEPSGGIWLIESFDSEAEAIIAELAATRLPANAYNQYADHPDQEIASANRLRRINLRLYWQQMASLGTKTLLVGEAAGYRGCRLTGIPFTSESLLMEGADGHGVFGEKRGYRKTLESTHIVREATATMVWDVLQHLWPPPLLWNAFPFHPHRPGLPRSNRAPTSEELNLGIPFLAKVVRLFAADMVLAVGNKAELALQRAGIRATKLRHPSHGGKARFKAGLLLLACRDQRFRARCDGPTGYTA